ncbi:pyridoxamine 5'-phosphate oxidase family protein [Actinacidiphila sp. DG2A-62]|uniref:pyridoxine/pyridoxamine 5'-phosphate oxidase n=1 Tax=Actinacidiphila sp. DG2A-62 TaxID=3108821 RepID=UPI002DB6CB75|nr:pyridoxamine 5'-phosphate oxidase family protein [Actinacidiphila sp. DG2A-62]MEC3998569.1 pyridoxamine 5'-phosphate oxidase family protein [Actinacidiphila sp. DG2A-62]
MGTDGTDGTGAGDGAAERDAELLARMRAAPVLAGELPRFDPGDAPAAPGPLFARWLERALADRLPEPHVMTLSTAGPGGEPGARVLMLRGVDSADCAFLFASDARSPKGRDLAANPRAALTFYWPGHGRQIRLTGPVAVLGPEAARQDYLGRSPASRAAGFTGRQSAPLSGPEEYERATREARAHVAADPAAVPATHTVYRLRAREAEFFQADPARGHLRLRYARTADGGWDRTLLWP